jgi:1,2-diacylglycerol 3-beta-galactosyltransferase
MKGSRPTILILTTRTGGGHLNLAQALKGILDSHYNVVIVNPQSNSVERNYTLAIRHFTKLLEWQYTLSDNAFTSFCIQRVVTLLDNGRIFNVIQHTQPQLIITTHALLSYACARAKEKSRKRIPLVFQLTDLGRLHKTWFIEKHADAYLAPTNEIFNQAMKQGITKDRLYLTGRPVRHQFIEISAYRKDETLAKLDFDPEVFTIFFQGGAKGSGGIDRTIEAVLSIEVPVQIILAVGNNDTMASRYTRIEKVRVLPFTETIAPYMAASDIIAGKAGASFISEAFMLEKPFIATACIPGQETPNLQFIKQHNLGWVCLETRKLKEVISSLAINPDLITEKKRSICAYKAWNMQAIQNLVPIIDQLLST